MRDAMNFGFNEEQEMPNGALAGFSRCPAAFVRKMMDHGPLTA
jgi:hypothetical protein